ncbi:MAG: NTP transferase domain-containing protein [Bacteroidia bacterium]|nr:NTP transferase domain-containing protein [Bacteroidia bacterium]
MNHQNLIGLVLAGGESQRMKTDKGLLNYHGKLQREYLYHLMQPYCEKVYICCKAAQAETVSTGLPVLTDEQNGIGPAAALLTAYHRHPKASFLVIGCDYPLFDTEHIVRLLSHRTPQTDAVVYQNAETGIPEALLGVYENHCLPRFEKEVLAGNYSLRFFLQQTATTFLLPLKKEAIQSIDTPEGFERIKKELDKKEKGL